MAKRRVGEIGSTIIYDDSEGNPIAEICSISLPTNKEELEAYFANRFISISNEKELLGENFIINNAKQNDTSDLDFTIDCASAKYLELAELTPLSESFGREAIKNGQIEVYEYSKWIWQRVILAKSDSYGEVAKDVLLLLYVTHWQFFTSDGLIACLSSTLSSKGCKFAAVVILETNGKDLNQPFVVYPTKEVNLPPPRKFKGAKYWNLPPGNSSWTIPI